MKKLTLIAIALVALATTFTSCKKDTTNDAAISLAGDAGYTATDATVAPGATIKVKWTATCTTTNMAYITISRDDSPITGWIDKEIPSASKSTYLDEASLTVPSSGGPFTYKIIIEDKDKAELTSKSIIITLGAVAGPISIYTAVLLGSNSNAAGSYLSTTTGTVYQSGDKQSHSSVIDIIYGTTASSVDEFFSPAIALSGITGGNSTKYATSTINFDNVTDDALLQSITATSDEISGISVGAEFQFITHAGKKGIFKVTAYTAGSSGSVTINVKVQQ
jgi:hypothetical protein